MQATIAKVSKIGYGQVLIKNLVVGSSAYADIDVSGYTAYVIIPAVEGGHDKIALTTYSNRIIAFNGNNPGGDITLLYIKYIIFGS